METGRNDEPFRTRERIDVALSMEYQQADKAWLVLVPRASPRSRPVYRADRSSGRVPMAGWWFSGSHTSPRRMGRSDRGAGRIAVYEGRLPPILEVSSIDDGLNGS